MVLTVSPTLVCEEVDSGSIPDRQNDFCGIVQPQQQSLFWGGLTRENPETNRDGLLWNSQAHE